MRNHPFVWLLRRNYKRLPAIFVMVLARMGHALCMVLFALGSQGVIDAAVAGDMDLFFSAAVKQGAIITGIVGCLTIVRHLQARLLADLEWDWKRRLLHGLLHGDYAAVSKYHSGELLNRMNSDVNKVNDGVVNILPNLASMVTRLVAAIVVLGALDPWFTLLIGAAGVVVIVGTAFMRKWLKELNKRVSEHDGRVSGFLQEIMEKLLYPMP